MKMDEHVKAAGGLTSTKGQTEWERPNRGTDGQSTDNARRRGGTESRHDRKHVGAQERASARSSHGLVPCLLGTAGYGPVCPVVWDPWLALEVSHGDPIGLLVVAILPLASRREPQLLAGISLACS